MLSSFSNILLVCSILFRTAIAVPISIADRYTIKERHDVPQNWDRIGAVPDSHTINLHVGLRQNNQDKVERRVLEASDPSHSSYGQHLSAREIQKLISPSDDTVRLFTSDYVPKVFDRNMIGVTNFLNNTQKRSDIRSYLEKFRPEAAGIADAFQIVKIAGAQDNQGVLSNDRLEAGLNSESDMDAELAIGISWPTGFTAWSTGGMPPFIPDLATPTDTNEPYLDWMTYVLAQDTLPQVISISYGNSEQTVLYSYAKRVCDSFKQLAARGISVLISSGDYGVGPNGTCFSNSNVSQSRFLPMFPASCPWVTSVGATEGFEPEVAVSRFGSGAGFSNYFPMPSYQTNAVDGYLDKIGNLYEGLYNRSGRAYPDVAAQGNHDVVVWGGNITTIGGTSASAPTFAAVIALVNDALIAAGKPPLGFLNPWIYSGAFAALTDITEGSSIGCNTSGFPAEVGWDAVTGFGTSNLGKLIAHAFNPYKK